MGTEVQGSRSVAPSRLQLVAVTVVGCVAAAVLVNVVTGGLSPPEDSTDDSVAYRLGAFTGGAVAWLVILGLVLGFVGGVVWLFRRGRGEPQADPR